MKFILLLYFYFDVYINKNSLQKIYEIYDNFFIHLGNKIYLKLKPKIKTVFYLLVIIFYIN